MGGFGSGRWNWHHKRVTAEESKRLYVKSYLEDLRKIERGELRQAMYTPNWICGGQPSGNVLLTLAGSGEGITAWLNYTATPATGQATNHHYQIGLTYTLTPWGSRRYWWTCPACGRRCGVLYMPPGVARFACRACHDLTYTTCQESHSGERFLAALLANTSMGDITPAEYEALIAWDREGKPPKKLQRYFDRQLPRILAELQQETQADQAAKYSRYLSAGELRELAGLSAGELEALHTARLLVPDYEGKYRPKLAGWAGKLATLLHAGWNIDELRRWSAGRWSTPNPRAWPPDWAAWAE